MIIKNRICYKDRREAKLYAGPEHKFHLVLKVQNTLQSNKMHQTWKVIMIFIDTLKSLLF